MVQLPASFFAYRKQQHRWTCGPVQLWRRCAKDIWRSSLPMSAKLELLLLYFGIRKFATHWVSLGFFCTLVPLSVFTPEVSFLGHDHVTAASTVHCARRGLSHKGPGEVPAVLGWLCCRVCSAVIALQAFKHSLCHPCCFPVTSKWVALPACTCTCECPDQACSPAGQHPAVGAGASASRGHHHHGSLYPQGLAALHPLRPV